MKAQKKIKTDYPFGCNQEKWDALREDAKNLILDNYPKRGFSFLKRGVKLY